MMKLANVYTDSRLATGVKDKIVALPPRSNHPDRTPNPGNGQNGIPPRISREPMRCFLCNEIGHKAQQCHKGRPPTHPAPNPRHKDKGPVYASVCLTLPVDSVKNRNAQPGEISFELIAVSVRVLTYRW